MKINADQVLRIARAVAARYRKICWWADFDDLVQTASIAVLESRETFDPQVGVPFAGYAARAASRQVSEALWRASTPLSGGLHDPERTIAGVHALELEDAHLATSQPDPGEILDDVRWRLRVRKRLRRLSARTKNGDLAAEVLLYGRASGDLIQETGRNAYRAVELTRRKVKDDAIMYKLLRRRPR
jgi:DNA-directed RNA polymerase specialized sigma24 family protein